jgi:hypothetical protein
MHRQSAGEDRAGRQGARAPGRGSGACKKLWPPEETGHRMSGGHATLSHRDRSGKKDLNAALGAWQWDVLASINAAGR